MTARILVVDDVPANVKLLEARLTAEYFSVVTAPKVRGEARATSSPMNGVAAVGLGRQTSSRWWRPRTAHKAMLMAGVGSVGVYVVGDVVSGLVYDGYSFTNQAISELSAFGSPVRPLMVSVILLHGVLLVVFGFGVLAVADRPSVRWVGILLVATGVVGFPTHTAWAMSSRGTETGFNDTMHITLTAIFSMLVSAAIVFSAVAYRGWFRVYALATLATLIGFGAAASFAMRGLDQNDTPGAGLFERINAYAYFAWIVVLALVLIRRVHADNGADSRTARSR